MMYECKQLQRDWIRCHGHDGLTLHNINMTKLQKVNITYDCIEKITLHRYKRDIIMYCICITLFRKTEYDFNKIIISLTTILTSVLISYSFGYLFIY